MTDGNPYEAPKSRPEAIGVRSGLRDDLKSVATYQKAILICILIYLGCVVAQFLLPTNARPILAIPVVLLLLTATVFVFLLSIKVYNVGLGILFGILTLVPCIGLLVLLLINAKATRILKDNGIPVGFLGADTSRI